MRSKAVLLLALVLTACGLRTSYSDKEYSFDGVKLVVKGENKPYDAGNFLQESYTLDPERRLLLRFEAFAEHTYSIHIDGEHRVLVQVAVANASDSAKATSALRLCPLSRDWMMLATWDRAHPFTDSGAWTQGGGEFDPQACLRRANETLDKFGDPNPAVLFDATRWFKDYPVGRAQNFGFVLVSDEPITIRGEKSASLSPRILFNVSQTVVEWRPEFQPPPAAKVPASAVR